VFDSDSLPLVQYVFFVTDRTERLSHRARVRWFTIGPYPFARSYNCAPARESAAAKVCMRPCFAPAAGPLMVAGTERGRGFGFEFQKFREWKVGSQAASSAARMKR